MFQRPAAANPVAISIGTEKRPDLYVALAEFDRERRNRKPAAPVAKARGATFVVVQCRKEKQHTASGDNIGQLLASLHGSRDQTEATRVPTNLILELAISEFVHPSASPQRKRLA